MYRDNARCVIFIDYLQLTYFPENQYFFQITRTRVTTLRPLMEELKSVIFPITGLDDATRMH